MLRAKSIWMFPKTGGKPPKWMVKIMKNPIKMDDLGDHYFWKHPYSRKDYVPFPPFAIYVCHAAMADFSS